jgi:hypothetical protein
MLNDARSKMKHFMPETFVEVLQDEEKKETADKLFFNGYKNIDTRGLYHKTFYDRNSQISIVS